MRRVEELSNYFDYFHQKENNQQYQSNPINKKPEGKSFAEIMKELEEKKQK